MKVCVFLLVEKKKEFNEFDLPDDALITDLKEALAESEGFPHANRLYMYLKTPQGHNLGNFKLVHFPQSLLTQSAQSCCSFNLIAF